MTLYPMILRWKGVIPNVRQQQIYVNLYEVPGQEPWPFTVLFNSLN